MDQRSALPPSDAVSAAGLDSLGPLIRSADDGDARAREFLLATLYKELRTLAQRELRRRGGSFALSVTTLLHEAYLLVADGSGITDVDRARFLAYASRAARGLVIDYARAHYAKRRDGELAITGVPTTLPEEIIDYHELEQIAEVVDALAAIDPDLAQVVDLKYFCGYSFIDIASMRNVSERSVERDWEKACTFLSGALPAVAKFL